MLLEDIRSFHRMLINSVVRIVYIRYKYVSRALLAVNFVARECCASHEQMEHTHTHTIRSEECKKNENERMREKVTLPKNSFCYSELNKEQKFAISSIQFKESKQHKIMHIQTHITAHP